VTALETFSQPHPLSAQVAVASLKRYIVDDAFKISLHDLIMTETERVYSEILGPNFSVNHAVNSDNILTTLKKYEAVVEILLALFITGNYWGDSRHQYLWIKSLERLANLPPGANLNMAWVNMRLYPALALLYGGGMAAIAAGNYDSFAALLTKVIRRGVEDRPLVLSAYPQAVVRDEVAHLVPNLARHFTPMNDHLFDCLREPLRGFLAADEVYEKTFDRFEYLRALVHGDLVQKKGKQIWGAHGRFVWKHHSGRGSISTEIQQELNKEGDNWSLLKAGLFDGSKGRIREIKQGIDGMVDQIPWY
jgi:hypothetical protein